MKKARLICAAIAASLITACGTTRHTAPVLDRTSGIKTAEASKAPAPALRADKQADKQTDGKGQYTVKKGDTLNQIAQETNQNLRDLIAWNNLANPNDIRVDQVLRLTPPDASTGPIQTGSVSTNSGVETRPLTQATTVAPVVNKSIPRGEKRPYSDAALLELQKQDASTATSLASGKAEKPAETKPVEKQPEIQFKRPEVAANSANEDEGISWIWPADGKIVSRFSDGRKGIDISGKLGQPVYAAGSGKVLYAGSGIRGYGNLVIVKHTNSLLSAYAHNKTIFVKEDQTVNKGQKIAEMGSSDSDAVKLHFEIRQQGKPVDPSKFLPNR